MTRDLAADLAEVFWHMTWDLCINFAMFFNYTWGMHFPFLLTDDMGIFDQIWQESWDFQENTSAICNLFFLRVERCNNPNAISTVCELVDMTCFASFRAQTVAEVLCHVIFFRGTLQITQDLCIFLFSFTLQMTWEFALFGYVRLLPCHLQVLYIFMAISKVRKKDWKPIHVQYLWASSLPPQLVTPSYPICQLGSCPRRLFWLPGEASEGPGPRKLRDLQEPKKTGFIRFFPEKNKIMIVTVTCMFFRIFPVPIVPIVPIAKIFREASHFWNPKVWLHDFLWGPATPACEPEPQKGSKQHRLLDPDVGMDTYLVY